MKSNNSVAQKADRKTERRVFRFTTLHHCHHKNQAKIMYRLLVLDYLGLHSNESKEIMIPF